MSIPKIIHQLWIGPKTPPTKFMDTWKNKHEVAGFEYIRWTEEEMQKRGFKSQLQNKVNDMNEINGKADILRWELLYEYGGFFVDADAYCIEPVTYLVEKYKAFVGYENEQVRGAGWTGDNPEYDDVLARTHPLIATGTMAFPPKHDLPRLAIEWIKNNDVNVNRTGKRAWRTVGPGLLTRLYHSKEWKDITVLPSYYFLPIHVTGCTYIGHEKVYANQEWGSTKNSYDNMNYIDLPDIVKNPKKSVSVLMPCYNINASYFSKTLESIKNQLCPVFINLVCINDGSNIMCTNLLKNMLLAFEKSSRWIKVLYVENEKNIGIGPTLHRGVSLCPDEIIFRMDSDDIMTPNRMELQLTFMEKTPNCVVCGGQVSLFKGNSLTSNGRTNHPTLTLKEYMENHKSWIMNHPTLCFKKSKILETGNYNKNIREMYEDFELELRLLKKYGIIHNIPNIILHYRDSPLQITKTIKNDKNHSNNLNKLIQNIIYS
tara:strand:- start:129 stop:1589 length:1461 start_codon:yes stop_codon:yes gene_type:complete